MVSSLNTRHSYSHNYIYAYPETLRYFGSNSMYISRCKYLNPFNPWHVFFGTYTEKLTCISCMHVFLLGSFIDLHKNSGDRAKLSSLLTIATTTKRCWFILVAYRSSWTDAVHSGFWWAWVQIPVQPFISYFTMNLLPSK